MLTAALPSTSRVLLAVPSLRQILVRALHPSQSNLAGGRRSVQPRSNRFGPSPSSSFSRDRPANRGAEMPPRRDGKPSFGLSRPSRYREPTSQRTSARSEPTTSRRLAPMTGPREAPPHIGSRPPAPPSFSRPKLAPTLPAPPRADPASLPRSFASFDLHPTLLTGLSESLGSSAKTTPIQSLSLSRLLVPPKSSVRAILGAETGSGKTLAYLLPLLHHLKSTDTGPLSSSRDPDAPLAPRAVVLSPTHELTRQSTGVAKSLIHSVKLSVLGGSSSAKGLRGWGGHVDLVLATGGTMRGMLKASSSDNAPGTARLFGKEEGSEGSEGRRVSIDLKRVEWLVIDEADVLLGPDFAEETLTTLSHFLDTVNILLVTATLPPSLIHHTANSPPLSAHQWTRVLSPGMHRLPSRLSTRFVSSTGGNLPSEVVKELKKAFAEDELAPAQAIRRREGVNQPFGDEGKTKAVVFCNSDSRVTNIAKVMREKGLECLPWTGEGEQRIRGKNGELDAFLKPTRPNVQTTPGSQTASVGVLGTSVAPRVLVTTSLLSRGLDFDPSVSTVILVDPPRDALDFVHRAGRAGRAGRSGRVIVFGMGDGRDLSGRGKVGKGVKGVVRPRVGSGSWSVEGRSGSGRTGPETRVPKAGMRR